jgi:hypothetical protein
MLHSLMHLASPYCEQDKELQRAAEHVDWMGSAIDTAAGGGGGASRPPRRGSGGSVGSGDGIDL